MSYARITVTLACLGAVGCGLALRDDDKIYYSGLVEPQIQCAASIDDKFDVSAGDDDLGHAIARAHIQGRTLHLYAHDPGRTVSFATVEKVLAMAARRKMGMVTYRQLGTGGKHGSIALSFDDDFVDHWTAMRPLLARYGAHVTFFVTRYAQLTDDQRRQLRALADDGHDIELHSVSHQNAVEYAAAHGVQAYVDDEILPELDAMEADGYDITSFAYPFGARSDELDAALAPYFQRIRALRTTCPATRD
jgi:hypothetical protein